MTDDVRPNPLPLDPTFPPSSFSGALRAHDLVPTWEIPPGDMTALRPAHGTTILALQYSDGVVMIGDRQATEGHTVAHRRMQKVFAADNYSAVAISGTAGVAVEMIRLFQTELEHYEKLEGARLSLEGKANYLATMVRNHLPLAFQGLVVIPLFCGFDEEAGVGRLYSFDVVGGRYEETEYATSGSGGREAKAYLRGNFRPGLDEEEALTVGLTALVVAAEEDTATAGPDVRRGIYPTVVTVTRAGYAEVDGDRVATLSTGAMEAGV